MFSLLAPSPTNAVNGPIALAGRWRFQLDRQDAGMRERWFERTLSGEFTLPGSLPAAGIGDDISTNTPWTGGIVDRSFFTAPEFAKYRQPGHVKVPFWLQPDKYYAGVAWFQRDIEIPQEWQGKRVVLFLERVHWESRVWVDGRCVGTNNSLSTPHEYELGVVARASRPSGPSQNQEHTGGTPVPFELAPGKHTVSIRVDNRRIVDIGENSHAITDHTQGNWNGIVGKIELRTTPLVWIEDVQVYRNVSNRMVRVLVRIGNATGESGEGILSIKPGAVLPSSTVFFDRLGIPVKWQTNGGIGELRWSASAGAPVWDEFNPALETYTVVLKVGRTKSLGVVWREVTFGLRDLSTSGIQLTINGKKTFIRGTLECCIFPKTGHPPMEVEGWRRIIRVAKSYGLNLMRFHSYCPPEEAFQAADELGFYFQVETCWANGGAANIGDGRPVDQWVYDETDRILKYYGNHPSFLLMLYGNEPGGRNANAYLAKYVEHFKAKDPRRLWSGGSGWPQLPENQFHVTPDPRIQAWGGGLKTRINARPPETTTDYRDYIAARQVPVISHEIGQWCAYPNFDEMKKYTGYLKPKNFEIFRDFLNEHGLGGLARPFLLASGKLQTLCYKEDIESALRTPGMGGFELLDLHDFPGQCTALVGVLDPFWEEKGYVTAAEYSRFCNSTVPLARMKKRVFTTDETLEAEIEVADFAEAPVAGVRATWKLVSEASAVLANGSLATKATPAGNGLFPLGCVLADLKNVKAPARCKFVVTVERGLQAASPSERGSGVNAARQTTFENDWDIWVYPARPATEPAKDTLVTAQFDDAAQQQLASGGKLLLTLPGKAVRNFDTAPVKLGFSSIFWNTAWTGRQAPTTLGILCDPQHPALAEFPTEFHSNWQWWYLVHRAGALRLDLLPKGTEPIVRVIDDWFTARPLGLVVEGKVGAGKVIVCGFDLTRDADDPVSKQMRASLLGYMASEKFAPKTELTAEQIKSLITEGGQARLRGVRNIKADSAQAGYEAENAIDGDATTMWHTAWGEGAPGFPHELMIEFDAPRTLTVFTALPRQDGLRNGWIKDYELRVSDDGQRWTEPVAKGVFSNEAELKTVKFVAPARAKFIKLVALSGWASGPWASLAEIGVSEAK